MAKAYKQVITVTFCKESHFGTRNPVISQNDTVTMQEAEDQAVNWTQANIDNNAMIFEGATQVATVKWQSGHVQIVKN